MDPIISVVMSVYNEPTGWVRTSIESILNQDFGNFELILILDNPEAVETRRLIKKYQQKDPRIVFLPNRENIGLIKSLNKGLRCARGELIARMDADDICLLNRFGVQYRFLREHPGVFLIGTSAEYVDGRGKSLGLRRVPTQAEDVKQELEKRNCIIHPTIMFRNEGFLYREKFLHVEDYDFYLQLLLRGKKLMNLDQPLLKFRLSSSSISFTNKQIQAVGADLARKFYFQAQEMGFDGYDLFNPERLLDGSLITPELELDLLRKQMIHRLDLLRYGEAKVMLKEYWKRVLKHRLFGRFVEGSILSMLVQLPVLYRSLRKAKL